MSDVLIEIVTVPLRRFGAQHDRTHVQNCLNSDTASIDWTSGLLLLALRQRAPTPAWLGAIAGLAASELRQPFTQRIAR